MAAGNVIAHLHRGAGRLKQTGEGLGIPQVHRGAGGEQSVRGGGSTCYTKEQGVRGGGSPMLSPG